MTVFTNLIKKRLCSAFYLFLSGALFIAATTATAEVVDKIVVIINDNVITLSEVNASAVLAAERLPDEAKADVKKMAEIKATILENVIEQKLVKQASDKAGIDVSEKEIDNAIEEVKKQNSFSHEALLLALAHSGLTYREFREQQKEQIRQVKFINKEFRSKIAVPDDEVLDYYKQNTGEFNTAASYRARMIFLSSKDKNLQKLRLKAITDGLKDKLEFEDLARDYSDGALAAEGGDLGYIKTGELDKTFEELVFKLSAGGVTEPIDKPEGIYIIQLVDLKRGSPRPFDEVKNIIRDKIFNKIMEERFTFWLKEAKKAAHIVVRM
ncbi:hypothetical protein EPN18_02990 [bacterium]|nr:MAG: hypothetical protein EPN18_02990 [bacterium]